MVTFSKMFLSGSTGGRPIGIASTSAPGAAIHTVSGSAIDEVWLYAFTNQNTSAEVHVEWGGNAAYEQIHLDVPFSGSGLTLVVPGIPLGNAQTIRAYADTSGSVSLMGYINRIV